MQNLNTDMKIKTTGVNKQSDTRWYFPADRRWKVTLDSDGSATVVEKSTELYRVIQGRAFNMRSMRDITESWNAEKYILPLAHYAREAEAQLEAKAQREARAEAEAKYDVFTYHIIFDADDVEEHDDIVPASQTGRYLAREIETGGLNSYRDIVNLLRTNYGAEGARPVALMRLRDGAQLGWNDKGLATIK